MVLYIMYIEIRCNYNNREMDDLKYGYEFASKYAHSFSRTMKNLSLLIQKTNFTESCSLYLDIQLLLLLTMASH